MSTFFNNLESYGLFLIYKMLIWTSRNIPNVGLFSAYAEVFLETASEAFQGDSFLCLRRGVSFSGAVNTQAQGFSLPTQRCFFQASQLFGRHQLFSAYAEVFLTLGVFWKISKTFLCLRRGVSEGREALPREICFSLPTQRCFFAHYWR